MSETFTGVVKSIGPEELGRSGHAKPRKVKISDNPERDGLTFKFWGDSPAFDVIELGKQVSVTFEPQQKEYQGNPYTDRMVVSAEPVGNGVAQQAPTQGNWDPDPPASQPQSQAPASKDDYWTQRQVMDEQRSHEMEAAWGVKAALDRLPLGEEIKHADLVNKAIEIIVTKRQVAFEMSKES